MSASGTDYHVVSPETYFTKLILQSSSLLAIILSIQKGREGAVGGGYSAAKSVQCKGYGGTF